MSLQVLFNDGSIKIFTGFWKYVIKEVSHYCDQTGLVTVHARWMK